MKLINKIFITIFAVLLSTNAVTSAEKWDMALAYGASNFHSANVDKIYRFSDLGHIKKLTISFSDNVGNKLSLRTNLNTDSWVLMDPKDVVDTNGDPTAKSPSLYIRHPYHSDYQHHLLFKLGTIENEIDKKVFH